MKAVSYVFEGKTFTDYYCTHHFNLVKGDVGITVADAPQGATCYECEMRDAAMEAYMKEENDVSARAAGSI